MITANHLTDAVPAAMFGIFALWAVSSTRHWFVRLAVIGAALLALLLIPAFEIVIIFGIEILVLFVGLTLWRKLRQRNAPRPAPIEPYSRMVPRLSLATMMLLVVVVAVATAVAARVPAWRWHEWVRLVGLGLTAGVFGLACIWLVSGRGIVWFRLLAFTLLAAVFAISLQPLLQAAGLLQDWSRGSLRSWSHYWDAAVRHMQYGSTYWAVVFVIGAAIIFLWMFLARRAGWFDPFRELNSPADERPTVDRGRVAARWGTIAIFVLASVFPVVLLYRLLTPPPLPIVSIPEPNGFDDLLAAGRMIGADDRQQIRRWMGTPNAPWPTDPKKQAAAIARMRQGLARPIVNPYRYKPWPKEEDLLAYRQLLVAANAEAESARRSGSVPKKVTAYSDMLQLAHEDMRGAGIVQDIDYGHAEQLAVLNLWESRTQLSATECIDLAKKLYELEERRESLETRVKLQRAIDANKHWESHLQLILAEWSGSDPYQWTNTNLLDAMGRLRILIVELGVRAFWLQHGRLPKNLQEIVPACLPGIPEDPYGTGAIKYRVTGEEYVIYSAGFDLDDDGGRKVQNPSADWEGDYTDSLYFPPLAPPPAATPGTAPQP